MHARRLFAIAAIAAGLAATVAAAQQSAHDQVRKSLVLLTAKGTAGSGPLASQPDSAQSQGTGFFVGDDGTILTTRHFFEPLEKVDAVPETVRITARIGGPESRPIPVDVLSELPNFDVMLLRGRIPFDMDRPPALQIGDSAMIDPAAPPVLLTSGFHGDNYRKLSAELNDTSSADVPYGLTLNVKTNHGQSGSPVYVESADGIRVVGIVKGTSAQDDELTIMIPIEYSMPLIGYLQMRTLQQQVEGLMKSVGETAGKPPLGQRVSVVEADVDKIGSFFNWSAETSADGSLRIRYEKIVGGAPQVDQIAVKVTPTMRLRGEGGATATGPTQPLNLTPDGSNKIALSTLDNSERFGEFVIPGVQNKLESLSALFQNAVRGEPYRDLEVIVIPTVGTVDLEPRKLTVVPSYEWK